MSVMIPTSPNVADFAREHELVSFDAQSWREGLTLPMRVASSWVKHVPRGKGWFPRWVGRHVCANDRVFIRTLCGAKLAVEPANLDIYTYIISQGGSWDEHIVDACQSVMGRNGVFYDIGASVGYISIEVASMLDSKGAVIAFEPQPELAGNIANSARLNGFDSVHVFRVMLGDHAGNASLHVGSHSIHASAIARETGSRQLTCTMTTLDDLVDRGTIRPPTVIKIDVEGAELAALSGARRTITKHRPHIIFESDENMDRYGYRRKNVLDLLSSLGPYEYAFITATKERIPLNAGNMETREHADVLASPAL
jgi:FkbM family methyltransferase